MVKFLFLAQFLVDHHPHPVVSSLVLFLRQFDAFVSIPTKSALTILLRRVYFRFNINKASFSKASTPRCREGCNYFLWIAPLTLDPYLIMLSVKHETIKYHLLSLWYDSTWDWTTVSRAIGKSSNHYAKTSTIATDDHQRPQISNRNLLLLHIGLWQSCQPGISTQDVSVV